MIREMSKGYHTPVLLKACIDSLNILPDGTYVDLTFGGGGHSREIMKHLGPKGRLFAFDQDVDAQQNLIQDSRFVLIPQNFRFLKNQITGFRPRELSLGCVQRLINTPSVQEWECDLPK